MKSEKGQVAVSAGTICFIILLIVAVCLYYFTERPTLEAGLEKTGQLLPSLPLSDHALQKQITTAWNVATITAWMEVGKCKPVIVYACPKEITKYICPLDPAKIGPKDLYAGIIVGTNTLDKSPLVITGWIAPLKTWDRLGRRDGCVSNTMPLDWLVP